jgi:glyoxylase-like metal-dependent hydrolase (beta-lactamase superfamily II)
MRTSFAILSMSWIGFAACAAPPPPAATPAAEAVSPIAPVDGAPAAASPAPATTTPDAAALTLKVFTSSPEGFLVNSTLVSGAHDAILIDAQFVLGDAKRLVAEIKATNKHLTTVYVTHFHPDHYWGFGVLKEAFPDAKLVALPKTVKEIESTALAKVKQWQPMFKDNIPVKPIVPEPIQGRTLLLEGQKLEIFGEQQGDTPDNSYVYIPSLSAVVCGDIVYSGVFPWTAESTAEQRKAWLQTLDRIAALNPKVVVAGHQRPDAGTAPSSLAFMKSYLKSYDEVLASSKTAAEAESKIKAQFPNLGEDFTLKLGLQSAYKR